MKRVEAETRDETSNTKSNTLLRDICGRALVRCEGCNKSVAVALRSMHNCSRVNLEAQAVETQTEAKKKPVCECGGSFSGRNQHLSDPLLLSPFCMNEFRKTFRAANLLPGSNVQNVPKQGAEKWKSMTVEEKKLYLDKAAELKAEHNKSLESNDANDELSED